MDPPERPHERPTLEIPPLTPQELGQATALCAAAALALGLGLQLWAPPPARLSLSAPLAASALVWGTLVVIFMLGCWDLYYRYFYPHWARWLAPLEVLLYAALGLGLWLLARPAGPHGWALLLLLGGAHGVVEHLLGIYLLRILQKVPFLQGLRPGPVLLFSLFEYALYWALVAWLAVGLQALI